MAKKKKEEKNATFMEWVKPMEKEEARKIYYSNKDEYFERAQAAFEKEHNQKINQFVQQYKQNWTSRNNIQLGSSDKTGTNYLNKKNQLNPYTSKKGKNGIPGAASDQDFNLMLSGYHDIVSNPTKYSSKDYDKEIDWLNNQRSDLKKLVDEYQFRVGNWKFSVGEDSKQYKDADKTLQTLEQQYHDIANAILDLKSVKENPKAYSASNEKNKNAMPGFYQNNPFPSNTSVNSVLPSISKKEIFSEIPGQSNNSKDLSSLVYPNLSSDASLQETIAKIRQGGQVNRSAALDSISNQWSGKNRDNYLTQIADDMEQGDKEKFYRDWELYHNNNDSFWLEKDKMKARERERNLDELSFVQYRSNFNQYSDKGKQKQKETGYINEPELYDEFSDTEKKIYDYHIGKDDKESADAYYELMNEELKRRAGQIKSLELTNDHGAAYRTVFSAATSLGNSVSSLGQAGKRLLLNDTDPIGKSVNQYAHEYMRPELGGVEGVVNDLAYTTANMAPSIAASMINPGLGILTIGVQSGGNTYNESRLEGYSDREALNYAAISGSAEALTQYALNGMKYLGKSGASKLFAKIFENNASYKTLSNELNGIFAKLVKNPSVRNTLKKIGTRLGDMNSEGIEEYVQEILDPVFRNITLGENNEFELINGDALYSYLLGALSAGVMNAPFNVNEDAGIRNLGKEIKQRGETQNLIDSALSSDPSGKSWELAQEISNKQQKGKKLSNYDVGQLYQTMLEENITLDQVETIPETSDIVPNSDVDEELQLNQNKKTEGISSRAELGKAMRESVAPSFGENTYQTEINNKISDFVKSQKSLSDHSAYQKITDAENKIKDKVSNKNVTTQISTGKEIGIKKIKSIDGQKMTFELDNGEVVNSNDVSYGSKAQALIYESMLSMGYDVNTANAIVNGYHAAGNMSASKYLLGINEAFNYGKIGYPQDKIDTNGFYANLTQTQKDFAYRLGAEQSGIDTQNAQNRIASGRSIGKRKKGKVYLDASVSSMTERQKVSVSAIGRVVSDITHNDVYLYESVEKNGKRVFKNDVADHKAGTSAPNGFYDPKTGNIYIDLNAGNGAEGVVLWTAAHELTHFIRQWSPAKFKILADFVISEYAENGIPVRTLIHNQMNKAKANGRTISFDVAYEELIADSMQTMFTDTNLAEKLAQLKVKDKTLWEKIKSFFADLYKRITNAYQELDPQSDEARYIREMGDTLNRISDLFADAVVDAGENYSASNNKNTVQQDSGTDGNVQYSIRYTTDNKPVAIIDDDILDGVPKSEWVDTVKNALSEKFSNGIPIRGRLIKVNAIARNEYTMSKDTQYYQRYDRHVYKDKFRSANNLDDIVLASTNYINEDLKHQRKDNFKEFARGDVLIRVGKNDYSAKVIVGFTSGKQMVLYDIIDFTPTDIELKTKKESTHIAQSQKAKSNRQSVLSSDTNVSQKDTGVNSQYMQNSEKNTVQQDSGTDDVRYSIRYTTDNKPVVSVNDDIIRDTVNDKELFSAVKKSLGRFKRVPIKGQTIYFIRDTKNEYVSSKYSQWLRKNNRSVFDDKMRVAAHPQDIVYATTDYVNEGLKHLRKDNIVDFARGNILIDVSGKQYTAEVVIGFTKKGVCELHDIVSLTPTNFKYKKIESTSILIDTNNISSRSGVPSNTDNVSQNDTGVNSQYMQNSEKNTVQQDSGTNKNVRYSLRNGAKEDVEKALVDKNYRSDVKLTDSSPSIIFSQKDAKNLPMVMKASHIRENVFTAAEAKKRGLKTDSHIHYHGLGEELFLKVVNDLEDVKLAYRGTKNAENSSRQENFFLLISQHKDANGNVINVPVFINETGQYNRVFFDTNKIATVFGRDNFFEYIQREIKKGNLVRIKNRSTFASERTADIADGYNKSASSDTNVPQNDTGVNSIISKNDGNDTNISFSKELEEYPYDVQTVIKDYISSVDKQLQKFIDDHFVGNKVIFGRQKISDVSEKQVNDIENLLDIDVSGYTNAINTNAIQHIRKRHGENGIADSSMKNEMDIARLGYILKNYDTVTIAKEGLDNVDSSEFRNSRNEPAPMLIYSKKINGTYYIAQAVPDSKYKKLWVVSAYINKKEAGTQALNTDNNHIGMSLASSASNTTISQAENSVNNSVSDVKINMSDRDYNATDSRSENDSSVKEQLKNSSDLLNRMDEVASVKEFETFNSKQETAEWVLKRLENTGYKISRKGFGEIILDKKRIKKGLSYLKTNEERLAFAAVPQVLSKGIEIGSHIKHKGRTYDTFTFAAPVSINGQRGNLAVVVRQEERNYYKVHRLVMPDGSQFVLDQKNKDIAETAGGVQKDSGLSPTDNVFNNSITQSDEKINMSDRDYNATDSRSLLSNALASVAQNEIERKYIEQYQSKIDSMNEQQSKLSELRSEIKQLSFAKGKRDTARIRALQDEAVKAANRINIYDKQLLRLEATAPLKAVIEREKTVAKKKAEQAGKEALAAYREQAKQNQRELMDRYQQRIKKGVENRNKTELKNKIRKTVKKLNTLMKNGRRKQNVKTGLRDTVTQALHTAELLFGPKPPKFENKQERIAYYVENQTAFVSAITSVTAEEQIKLEKYRNLLDNGSRLQEQIARINPSASEQVEAVRSEIYKNYDALLKTARELAPVFARERTRLNTMPVGEAIGELAEAYQEISKSQEQYIKGVYSQDAYDRLLALKESLGGTAIIDMNPDQLRETYDAYKMILHMVTNSTKLFKAGKWEDVVTSAEKVMLEVRQIGKPKEERIAAADKANTATWNNLKPVYAFERIGSETMMELYKDLVKGESTWGRDIGDAKQFIHEVRGKYQYQSWNTEQKHKIKLSTGKTVELTLPQMMSIYAYSKRKQALDHMEKGGFVFNTGETFKKNKGLFKYVSTRSDAFRIGKDDIAAIKSVMSEEQIAYVDDMQQYLTEVMGEKGNEASNIMFGIDLFKEKVYFPLKSSKDFISEANTSAKESSLKNSGMTKETSPNASNPIVLENFDDVWANHVNRMSTYHSFVVPIDNFNKVFHFSDYLEEGDSSSVQTTLRSVFGNGANDYIKKLIQDINGGVSSERVTSPLAGAIGTFKKTAVAASLSVTVQQPTAILRAMSMVDPKYFIPDSHMKHSDKWNQLKKYAPVAVIKEIGGFDAGSSWQASSYLTENKTFMEKADDVLMRGAGFADELGWNFIWDAVKRETKAESGLDGEALLIKAGERFTEVIHYTQVYDSTLSRSGYMRSQSDLVKMATAFMGEPTTTFNMIYNAVLQAKRKKISKRTAARHIGFAYVSVIAANVLKSFIGAGRDDDDDKTYWEKYLGTLTGNIISDSFIPNMLPFVKDIISIFEGWDVERTDMTLISDLKQAIDGMTSDTKSTYRKIEDLGGALGNLCGIPAKNIMRDARTIYNTFVSIFLHGEPTTAQGVKESVFENLPFAQNKTKSDRIYEAVTNGDNVALDRVKKQYKTQAAYRAELRKSIKEHDSRIEKAATANMNGDMEEYKRIVLEIKGEGYFSQDDIVAAVNSKINELTPDDDSVDEWWNDPEEESEQNSNSSVYTSSDLNSTLNQGNYAAAKTIINDLVKSKQKDGKTEKEAKGSTRSSVTSHWKPLYLDAYKSKDNDEMYRIRKILNSTGLYGDVSETTQNWVKNSKKN